MKTGNRQEAEERALKHYDEIVWRHKFGLAPKSVSFNQAGDSWLKVLQAEVDAGQRKRRTLIDYEPVVTRYLKPFFGSKAIDAISKHDVSKYAAWRRDYWLNGDGSRLDELEYVRHGESKRRKSVQKHMAPSARTLNKENVVLRGIFKHAVEKGWLTEAQVPKIKSPKISTSMTRERARPIFTWAEYHQLRQYMKNWIRERGIAPREEARREAIQDCLLILFGSGLRENELLKKDERTGQWSGLRWCDIAYFDSVSGIGLAELTIVRGKTGPRKVIPQRGVRWVLERRHDKRCPNHKSTDYVLALPDGTLTASFDSGMRRLLKQAELLTCPITGANRTLYSCRHSYATWRLQANRNPKIIAANMGTSLQMLEATYYHHMPRTVADHIVGSV